MGKAMAVGGTGVYGISRKKPGFGVMCAKEASNETYKTRARYVLTQMLTRTHDHKRTRTPNQKGKLNGRKIRATSLYRSVSEIM